MEKVADSGSNIDRGCHHNSPPLLDQTKPKYRPHNHNSQSKYIECPESIGRASSQVSTGNRSGAGRLDHHVSRAGAGIFNGCGNDCGTCCIWTGGRPITSVNRVPLCLANRNKSCVISLSLE